MSDRIVTAPISKIVEAIKESDGVFIEHGPNYNDGGSIEYLRISTHELIEALQSMPTQDININAKDYGYGASETRSGKAFERGYRLGFTANSPTQDEREVIIKWEEYKKTREVKSDVWRGEEHYKNNKYGIIDRYLAQRGGGE